VAPGTLPVGGDDLQGIAALQGARPRNRREILVSASPATTSSTMGHSPPTRHKITYSPLRPLSATHLGAALFRAL
jgi:hypothetical protein